MDVDASGSLSCIRKKNRQRTRRRLATILALSVYSLIREPSAKKMRTQTFWETHVLLNFGVAEWYMNFRMPKEEFFILCELIRPRITKECTVMKAPVSPEKRVGLTLYKLASNIGFHDLANLFGIGASTACEVFWEVCQSLCDLRKDFISLPKNHDELKAIISGFEEKTGFPMCVGALDSTHIPVIAPSERHTDYYNRKGWYSIILQGLVDHKYKFIDFDVGWPGKYHNSFVFQNSKLCHRLEKATCFPPITRNINGVDVPVLILVDSAYDLSRNIMRPFPEGGSRGTETKFNNCLSRVAIHIKQAFSRLKGRWRCLMKRNCSKTKNVKFVVAACIVLHNFCESRMLQVPPECTAEIEHDKQQEPLTNDGNSFTDQTNPSAECIRNAIASYIFENDL